MMGYDLLPVRHEYLKIINVAARNACTIISKFCAGAILSSRLPPPIQKTFKHAECHSPKISYILVKIVKQEQ